MRHPPIVHSTFQSNHELADDYTGMRKVMIQLGPVALSTWFAPSL
jgi:hypothetical protein